MNSLILSIAVAGLLVVAGAVVKLVLRHELSIIDGLNGIVRHDSTKGETVVAVFEEREGRGPKRSSRDR